MSVRKARDIFTLSLLAALTACNGGGSDTTDTTSTNVQYTAIDGYLVAAEVYADRNLDSLASSDELIGSTDENGTISISAEDTAYPIIVKIIAGHTTDSDVTGALSVSKELIAGAGITKITPFSTLAFINNVDLPTLATDLGLDPDEISGDFIANGHTDIHSIARSLYQLMDSDLSTERGNVAERLIQASNMATYTKNNPNTDWTDKILELDENNNVTEDSADNAIKTVFDWSAATVQWELKDYDEYITAYSTAFHPCDAKKWTDDIIIVGNCFTNYFLTLNADTGAVIDHIDVSALSADAWYIDDKALTIVTPEGPVYYNTNLKPITNYSPTDAVRLSGDGYTLSYADDNTEVADLIAKFGTYGTNTDQNTWLADGVAYRAYDMDTGILSEAKPDGTVTTKTYDDAATITGEVEPYHNGLAANLVLDADAPTATDNNTTVRYLSKGTFLVRVSSDSNSGYNTPGYHYFYHNGKTTYLGKFLSGDWYKGLDTSTISWYTSTRSYDDANYTHYAEPHQFKQFDLETGEMVGSWEMSHDEFAPVLYSQQHTDLGVLSVSDSYSSVSLIK